MATPKMKVIRNFKSDAVLFGHGRSADRFVDDTTGTHNFWQLYTKSTNASGITRGLRIDMTIGDGTNTTTSTYEALRAYIKVDNVVPAGGSVISAYMDFVSGACNAAQHYVGAFTFAQTAGTTVGGGRQAVLNLNNTFADAGFSGNAAACSFINFADGNTTYVTPTLFTMPGWVADASGCPLVTNTASNTHGIKINCGNTAYYLAVQSTHS